MDTNRVRDWLVDCGPLLLLAVLLALIMFTGCSVCKPKPVQVVYRDSVRVEYRERIVRDTVQLTVDKEVEKIVTRDTVSRLANRWAKSEARVSGGFLTHTLESIPQVIEVPVEHTVRDTVIVEKHGENTIETVEVEKSLTGWQKFRIGAFWWLLGLTLIGWHKVIDKAILAIIKLFTK